MRYDTWIGEVSSRFPATRWSAVAAARAENAEERARALDSIVSAYWKPVYKYLRVRWGQSNKDAKDPPQEFSHAFWKMIFWRTMTRRRRGYALSCAFVWTVSSRIRPAQPGG